MCRALLGNAPRGLIGAKELSSLRSSKAGVRLDQTIIQRRRRSDKSVSEVAGRTGWISNGRIRLEQLTRIPTCPLGPKDTAFAEFRESGLIVEVVNPGRMLTSL